MFKCDSIIDWKTCIQIYLQNLYYWLQNAIQSDSWIILQKSRIKLYLQNATRYTMSPASAKRESRTSR